MIASRNPFQAVLPRRWRALFALAVGSGLLPLACTREPPPGAGERPSSGGSSAPVTAGQPTLPSELRTNPTGSASATPVAAASASAAVPHPGPWLAVTAPAAAVYAVRDFDKQQKLGYLKSGGRAAIKPGATPGKSCSAGWYDVVGGGYLCGNLGTTDLNHPQVKFAIRQPDLNEVLPYQYARNAKNGTPLYKSVPSREQMLAYEPYLGGSKEDGRSGAGVETAVPIAAAGDLDGGAERERTARALADAGVALPFAVDAGEPEPDKPWWQREDAKDRLHEVKLEELTADADDILAKRMVTGFYVAVDKTFNWNGRTWYKTTKGLVAPADRFWQTAGGKFRGVELDAKSFKLPVAWTYGGRKTAPTYEVGVESKQVKPKGTIDVFTAVQLTGRELDVKGTRYFETSDGVWLKSIHVRVTRPGAPPHDLAPNERWIDVNLKEQTLVAFEGTRPVYATLVSSGKQSEVKDKDHRTPSGEWRIREKHITTTMDGDGSAAGDLPYSIEDVPYVMYFSASYALHGAFWHRNFGVQMSHGCVNLAPLDAKHLFFFADPPLPTGWHGVWSARDRPGSRIVIHE